MQAALLSRTLDAFLADSRDAVVMEDGAVVFEMARARYSVTAEHGKCLLHLWSDERNTVRRIVDAEPKNGVLRLAVLRFGQSQPSQLEICRDRDRRTATAKRIARNSYEQRLRRLLEREFPGFTIARLTSAMDLERSCSPVYTRGLLKKGRSAFAVLGVNAQETQASVDAALTFGMVWLDACRLQAVNLQVEGLKLFVPQGASAVARERMAHLERTAAKWQLYTLDEREQAVEELDTADRGNLATRLVYCPNRAQAEERFAAPIARVRELCQQAEVAVFSAAEIGFRLRGLEFARARLAPDAGSFRSGQEIVFGVAGGEAVLDDGNTGDFAELVRVLGEVRRPSGPRDHLLWRLHPERWLESLVVQDVAAIDERLDPACVYSQVPAFACADRAMIDVLATARDERLAVLELKAEEDIHLPLQGVDYWARVKWHHQRGEFQRFGYFPGRELGSRAPLLLLVAPALHIHPATDTLLRYLSPEIEWVLVGIDERWRDGVRVIFRKRRKFTAEAHQHEEKH